MALQSTNMENRYFCCGSLVVASFIIIWSLSAIPFALAKSTNFADRIAELYAAARYDEALTVAQEYAANAKQDLGKNGKNYAVALSWMAQLNQVRGRLDLAGPLFEQALEAFKKAVPPGSPDIATAINNLGVYNWMSGRYQDAEKLYKRALEMRERALPPDDPEIATSLNNIAHIYTLLDRSVEAEPVFRRSLAIREKKLPANNPLIAQSLQNLATSLEMQGRYAEAEPLLRRAVRIRERSQVRWHPEIAGATAKLARNLFSQGQSKEAERLFKAALEMRTHFQAADHPDVAGTKEDLAYVYTDERKCEEARRLLVDVLASRQAYLPKTSPDTAGALSGISRTFACQGRYRDALQYARQATAIYSQASLSSFGASHYENHLAYAWKFAESSGANPSPELLDESFGLSQIASQTNAAASITQMAARFAAKDPVLQKLVRERQDLEASAAEVEHKLSSALAMPAEQRRAIAEPARAKLDDIARRQAAIDDQLKLMFPTYFELVRPQPVHIAAVQGLLKNDEAFVDFFVTYDDVYVWCVTKDSVAWKKADITAKDLARMITELRSALDPDSASLSRLAKQNALFDLGTAFDLYRRLFGPIESVVRGKSQLVLVTTGPLTSLPLHLLVTQPPIIRKPNAKQLHAYREADWLVKHVAISVLPAASSLRDLRTAANTTAGKRPLIGFGNPFLGNQHVAEADLKTVTRGYAGYWQGKTADIAALRATLPQLPEAEDELKAVAGDLSAAASDLYFGRAATETEVKQPGKLADYAIVYFATHGLVAGQVKGLGEPALVLALPDSPTELDDGLLTASEVSELSLNADWVVLSACNTAAGDKPGAEALSGLARAFFQAGARSLLVSNWPVDSDSATHLTTVTFAELRKSRDISRSEALRRSMVSLIDDASDDWNAYPAYWAPFILVGGTASH